MAAQLGAQFQSPKLLLKQPKCLHYLGPCREATEGSVISD